MKDDEKWAIVIIGICIGLAVLILTGAATPMFLAIDRAYP